MSAKHGAPKIPSEAYATPLWCVEALLREVDFGGGHWLEPCAGEGNIIRAVSRVRPGITWDACELRPECEAPLHGIGNPPIKRVLMGDFFSPEVQGNLRKQYDVVLTNPPFSKFPEFLNACRVIAHHTIFLLRLNVLEGVDRSIFWRNHCPDVLVLPQRPSFTGHGTDATAYAWFVVHGTERRTHGHIRVLAPVSDEDRKHRS